MNKKRRSPGLTTLFTVVLWAGACLARADPLEWSFRYSLAMSRHPTHLTPILAQISGDPAVRTQDMLDFVAEVLLDTSTDATFPKASATELANVTPA